MVIFPDGARSMTTNEMGEFKRGALKAAISVGAEIIPFRFDNLYAVLEGNGKLKVTPRQVDVYFGVPIPTAGLSKEEQWALADKVKETIINLK